MAEPDASADVTALLVNWSNGDSRALDDLMPLVYGELRRLAGAYLRRERATQTLQSTGIAAQMIRRILVDHARAAQAGKRGAGAIRIELDDHMAVEQQKELDLVGLDDSLAKLAALDERQARIVELRFFAGLSVEEAAEVMQISTATVKREWSSARAWLYREMTKA